MSAKLPRGEANTMRYLLYRLKRQIIEIGDCWEWQGYITTGCTPTWRYWVNGAWSATPVRRTILLIKGIELASDERAMPTCGNKLCVNPAHVTKQNIGQVMYERNQIITRGANGHIRAAKIAAKRRQDSSPLTQEQVNQIRAHVGAAHEVADQYGISAKTFNAIRRGERWKDYTNPWRGLMT